MWCNWGFAGRGMWLPHFAGPFALLLFIAVAALVVWLIRRFAFRSPRLKCPACGGWVEAAFLRCPHCGAGLKRHCRKCSGIIEAGWRFCPACEEEIDPQAKKEII